MAPENSSARLSFQINENPIKKGLKQSRFHHRTKLRSSHHRKADKTMIFRHFSETFHSSLEASFRFLTELECWTWTTLGNAPAMEKGYFVCAGRHLDCLVLLYTLLKAGEFINTIILWKNLHIVT